MLNQIGTLLVDSLGSLFVYVLLLRFHMQWLRAPFRNPIGEFVAALTNWIVMPMRRAIPGLFGLDLATLFTALLAEGLMLALLMSIRGYPFANAPATAFLVLAAISAFELARMSVALLIGVAILQAVLSFVAPYSPFAPLLDALTRRFYAPFRRIIPTIGNVDISPLFLVIAAQIVIIMLEWLRRLVGAPF